MAALIPGHLSAGANPNTVYRYYDHAERLIYIGITARGIQRQAEHEKLSDWFGYAASQRLETCPDRTAALALERDLIKAFRPPFNKVHNEGWEPIRAAYLAVAVAEARLASMQAGAEEACWPCPASEEDGEACQFGSRAMRNDGFGFVWCEREDCLPCHWKWHGFDEALPVGYDEGRKSMASAVDHAHGRGWDEASDIYAADSMAAIMVRGVVDGNLRRLGPSYIYAIGGTKCPPTMASFAPVTTEDCPY